MTTKQSPFLTKHHWVIAIAALLLLTLACGLPSALQSLAPGEDPAPTPTITPTPQPLPPALVETDPPPGSKLPLDASITLYFNQAMERASVEAALVGGYESEAGAVQSVGGSITWLDDATLIFTPDTQLPQSTELILEIAASARAANGLTMLDAVSFSYLTAPPLEVVQILPEPGLTDVDPASAVVVTFNQPVVSLGADPDSLPDALIIEPSPDGHGEWVNTSTYIFYPETALFGGATYSINVNPKLSSTTGASLASALEWSFSTASPRLISIEPGDGSSAVPLDASFTLTFNQPMDTISIEGHFTMHDADGEYIPGSFEWQGDDSVVVFTPSELLSRNTEYSVQLPFGAQALGGTPLGVSYSAIVGTVPGLMITSTDPLQGGYTGIYSGVTLYFSSFVLNDDDIDLLQYISITPEVPDLYYWMGWEGGELHINGNFDPQTAYQITIAGDLPDAWGGTLGMDYLYNFQTSALDASLNFSQYSTYLFITPADTSLAAQVTNISGVDMILGEVPYADFVGFLGSNGYNLLNEYQAYNWQIWNQSLNLPGDRMYKVQLPVQPDGAGLAPGLYHLSFSAPEVEYPPNPFVLVSSNLNLTFKLSPTQVFVWAVDLRTNAPVSDAAIGIYRSDGTLLASGVSDENGIFQSAIPAQENIFDTYYALIGQPGDDHFALSLDNWSEGINGYDFGLYTDFSGPEIETYVYTDRPIYRPGQTVSFRAVVRQAYNGRYTPANLGTLPVKIYDQNMNTLLEGDFSLSTFGTAHGQYLLPENAQPGTYEISTDYGGVWFDVAEYRKPEINLGVSISAGAADILADQTIQAQVAARYYFDAPAGDLTLSWNLYKQQDYFYLPGFRVGEESYGWMYPYWMGYYFGYYGEQVASG
nr:Ig-like domain-containing protein [Chloroflexota bacterium]